MAGTPPVTLTWYQRGAANPAVLARRTVCVAHSDSAPSMLLYWFCIIARICRTSSALPPCDGAFGTPALGQADGASGASGPVNVDRATWVQSTWNL